MRASVCTLSVYALGIDNPGQQDRADRAAFLSLAEALRDFGAPRCSGAMPRLPAATSRSTTARSSWTPRGSRARRFPGPGTTWTSRTSRPRSSSPPTPRASRKAQALKVTDEPYGGLMSLSVEAPDGTVYSLNLRPLLPDEEE